jgi:hypothetical protein
VLLGASKIDVELWRLRGVEILDVPLDDYAMELERRLVQFDVGTVPA